MNETSPEINLIGTSILHNDRHNLNEHDCDSITAKLNTLNDKRVKMVEAWDLATRRGNKELADYYKTRMAEFTKAIQALEPPQPKGEK